MILTHCPVEASMPTKHRRNLPHSNNLLWPLHSYKPCSIARFRLSHKLTELVNLAVASNMGSGLWAVSSHVELTLPYYTDITISYILFHILATQLFKHPCRKSDFDLICVCCYRLSWICHCSWFHLQLFDFIRRFHSSLTFLISFRCYRFSVFSLSLCPRAMGYARNDHLVSLNILQMCHNRGNIRIAAIKYSET